MNPTARHYVSNRVLKLNVGFLISDGPGHSHETEFDVPAVRVDDDLDLEYIRGPLRLSRTKEGILVQGVLQVGIRSECNRCLDPVLSNIVIEMEELYSYPLDAGVEFSISEDMVLDLAPLMRDEALIQTSRGLLCRDDCQGLCPECGTNLNDGSCDCAVDDIDPRLAGLKKLLDRE